MMRLPLCTKGGGEEGWLKRQKGPFNLTFLSSPGTMARRRPRSLGMDEGTPHHGQQGRKDQGVDAVRGLSRLSAVLGGRRVGF